MDDLTWRHVAVTFDSSAARARLYIDGVLKQTEPIPAGFVPNTRDDLYFAHRPGGACFKGMLDEISFFRRALSPTEVYTIYAAGSIGKCPADLNRAPDVNAGPDRIATLSVPLTLSGQVTDDGLRPKPRYALSGGSKMAPHFPFSPTIRNPTQPSPSPKKDSISSNCGRPTDRSSLQISSRSMSRISVPSRIRHSLHGGPATALHAMWREVAMPFLPAEQPIRSTARCPWASGLMAAMIPSVFRQPPPWTLAATRPLPSSSG